MLSMETEWTNSGENGQNTSVGRFSCAGSLCLKRSNRTTYDGNRIFFQAAVFYFLFF